MSLLGDAPSTSKREATAAERLHASLMAYLLGTADEESPLSVLSGHSDVLRLIWHVVNNAWKREQMMTALQAQEEKKLVAFAHVDNVTFPAPKSINVNMMPFILGDKRSLPPELHAYWPMIAKCTSTLHRSDGKASPKDRVGYLTVHESVVHEGASQRRPGLHTEGFNRDVCDSGKVHTLPRWHPWGFGHAMRHGQFEGGLFMASNVSDSCHIYNAIVPTELVGRGGDVEPLRPCLNERFPSAPKPRTCWPADDERYGSHAGCARCDMHLEGDDIFDQRRVTGPIALRAGELVWFTDRTPHESRPLPTGQPRQFFRLVTGGVDTWYAAHSTPNPLGTQPDAAVVHYDKFTGEPAAALVEAAPTRHAPGAASSCAGRPPSLRQLAAALAKECQV
mmetsp:Transcript_4879/g.14105  ORF Transcript_4879/g.14105 Transcript_4879/m.14105 type:complete len:393 (+) Transcript_4879:115-1293(+)